MNILYLGNIDAIHDFKWASFFSVQQGYKVYFLDVGGNDIADNDYLNKIYNEAGIHFLKPVKIPSFKRLDKWWGNYSQIKGYIKQYQIDVVHSLSVTTTSLFLLRLKTPYIITTRGSDILVELTNMKARGEKGSKMDAFMFRRFKKLFAKAKAVTGTSIPQTIRTKEIMGRDAQLVRTGLDFGLIENIDCSQHLPAELKGKKYIFSPRLIRPIYNIELQVEAIKLLDKSILEEYAFVFIQFKERGPEYVKMIKDGLDSTPHLKYHVYNNIPQEEMFCLFKNAQLAVMTPKSDGTPNSALEAMALKCPLIVGDLDYDSDLFDDMCIRLTKNDPQELADKITQALKVYSDGMLKRAYQNVKERGNRDVEMRRIQGIYEGI